MKNSEIDKLAKIVWDYHHLNQPLKKADCILVLGSHDTRVAEYAADLFIKGYAPSMIFSGNVGNLTEGLFDKPEAEVFANIAVKKGVPKDRIIIENKATNTGENILFTKKLITDRGLNLNSFLIVQKPYMERRVFATFKKLWPEKEFTVTSPPFSFEQYPDVEIPKDKVINIMVGDLQRIKLYPKKGYQIYQEIPAGVWSAYEKLVELGFIENLI